MLDIDGIYFHGYKSFNSKEGVSIDQLKNINLIIGKNNSGKSSIIDIICYLFDIQKFSDNRGKVESIEYSLKLNEKNISSTFDKYTSGGGINENHYSYGARYIGDSLRVIVDIETNSYANSRYHWKNKYSNKNDTTKFGTAKQYWDTLAARNSDLLSEYSFRRLNAERNIVPEMEEQDIELHPDGSGASNMIRKFINFNELDEKKVEVELLNELNKIMYPDAFFESIRVQQIESNGKLLWEIFLEEKEAGRFALSQSGSGLKTIILILINIILIPEITKNKLIFAFEEIENNLHPALQRRVFDYLYSYSENKEVCMFITTHSHVAINAYNNKHNAQIIHVCKENNTSTISIVDNYIDKIHILDDLDVRASDLFQANGIIWVEGPSDRVYINKWISIFGNNELIEGKHYQFLYYGGKLLSHYSALSDEESNLISILLTNRNSIIVIDSDKRSKKSHINSTKIRIQEEFKERNCLCWITKGKEIENYLCKDAIEKFFNVSLEKECGQYELFPVYIKKFDETFSNHKVDFANRVSLFITDENSKKILDLKQWINKICYEINKWNKLNESISIK